MRLRKLLITTIATISLANGMGYIFTTNTQPVKAVSFEKLYNEDMKYAGKFHLVKITKRTPVYKNHSKNVINPKFRKAYVLKPGKKVWIQYFGNYGRTYVIGKSLKYCTFREGTNWFKPLH